jgi:hypothetical protein
LSRFISEAEFNLKLLSFVNFEASEDFFVVASRRFREGGVGGVVVALHPRLQQACLTKAFNDTS